MKWDSRSFQLELKQCRSESHVHAVSCFAKCICEACLVAYRFTVAGSRSLVGVLAVSQIWFFELSGRCVLEELLQKSGGLTLVPDGPFP